jgi:hypothetical protein
MANILGFIYLGVLFVFCILYMAFQMYVWIDRLKARKKPLAGEPENPPEPVVTNVVGKSTTVFLAPLHEPVTGEQKPEPAVETEPEIQPADVEVILKQPLDMDEIEIDDFQNVDMDASDYLSQGLTFEQIGHAVEVVEGRKSGEADEYLAGETFSLMPPDFMTVICMQADREAMVKKLMAGYLDFPDKMKPVPVEVTDFDINNYV